MKVGVAGTVDVVVSETTGKGWCDGVTDAVANSEFGKHPNSINIVIVQKYFFNPTPVLQ